MSKEDFAYFGQYRTQILHIFVLRTERRGEQPEKERQVMQEFLISTGEMTSYLILNTRVGRIRSSQRLHKRRHETSAIPFRAGYEKVLQRYLCRNAQPPSQIHPTAPCASHFGNASAKTNSSRSTTTPRPISIGFVNMGPWQAKV